MKKRNTREPSHSYPEYAVRPEVISRYFSPPLASSTFYDFVNKGKIVPMKGIRGYYKLNDSLVRLGLRPVPELPDLAKRTDEDITRLAFHMMDEDTFPPPPWFGDDEMSLADVDVHRLKLGMALHASALADIKDVILKHSYLDGALCAGYLAKKHPRDEE